MSFTGELAFITLFQLLETECENPAGLLKSNFYLKV